MSKNIVTLLAGGDIGPDVEPVDRIAELILPVLRQADLRFGQCDRIYTERTSQLNPWSYSYLHPRKSSIWKTAGIDIVSVASNNIMNKGPEALMDTIELLRSMGSHPIGAGKNIAEARRPLIVERNGVKIAFLGYCSVLPKGHEAGPSKIGIAPMRADTKYMPQTDPHELSNPGVPPEIVTVPYEEDLQALQEDIKKAKQQADAVVMSIHWGLHFIPKTICDYQPLVAHAAIDAGADLILGHHAHTLKAVEVYKGKVCFYSLGNFMTTSDPRLLNPAKWNRWNFYWYRLDPEYMKGIYYYPPESRMTMIAKAVFSKQGIDKISFLPAFINPLAQPAVVTPGNVKFQEILEYVEWLSDQHVHKFQVEGDEIVVGA